MPGLSVYTENALLNTFRNTSFSVTTIYISLHTASPGTTGANEVTGGAYARVAVTFGAPSLGSMTNTGIISVNVPASTTVTHFSYWDSSNTGATPVPGNWLAGTALAASQSFGSSGTLSFAIGQLIFALTC